MRHVPEMHLNLISTGKLDDAGFLSHFGNRKWKLAKGNLVIVRGQRKDPFTLCKEEFVLEKQMLLQTPKIFGIDVWDMSEKTLQMLAKNYLSGIKGQILESCTDYIMVNNAELVFRDQVIPQGDMRYFNLCIQMFVYHLKNLLVEPTTL